VFIRAQMSHKTLSRGGRGGVSRIAQEFRVLD
jgi:hypothetical protein